MVINILNFDPKVLISYAGLLLNNQVLNDLDLSGRT